MLKERHAMVTIMRDVGGRRRARKFGIAALIAAAVCAGAYTAAGASDLYREHIYADSYGNLVVYSPAGYKRIVVGKGYLADEMRSARADHGPKIVYLHEGRRHAYRVHCRRHAVLLHGRSYMYGLPDNVVPEPSACE